MNSRFYDINLRQPKRTSVRPIEPKKETGNKDFTDFSNFGNLQPEKPSFNDFSNFSNFNNNNNVSIQQSQQQQSKSRSSISNKPTVTAPTLKQNTNASEI